MESSAEEVNFGRSLIVPSVQELAKQPLINIPPRYVHHDHHLEDSSHYDSSRPIFQSVPIIDLGNLIYGESLYDYELEKLHKACQQWGFFQVITLSSILIKTLRVLWVFIIRSHILA